MTTTAPPLPAARQRQLYGSYASWDLPGPYGRAIDLAWRSRMDATTQAEHILLPFIEPSLVIRRRLSRGGAVEAVEMVVTPACPDGGCYIPARHEEQFAVRLAPESVAQLGLDPCTRWEIEMSAFPAPLRRIAEPVLRLAESGRVRAAWALMIEALSDIDAPMGAHRVSPALAMMRREAGRADIRALAHRLEISPRQLRRAFNDNYGASPRTISRRLRLTSALLEAETSARPDWAGIAAGNGYSDQSHLIRECQDIIGSTPARLWAQRQAMAVTFNN